LARGQGSGTGGPGQGSGLPGEAENSETTHSKDRLRGAFHKGKMVASYLEKGEAPKGDSRIELQELMQAGQRFAEETLEKVRYPADYQEIPKKYFERIRGQ